MYIPVLTSLKLQLCRHGICCLGEQWSSDESLIAIQRMFLSRLDLPLRLILVKLQCHREGEFLFLPLPELRKLMLEVGLYRGELRCRRCPPSVHRNR